MLVSDQMHQDDDNDQNGVFGLVDQTNAQTLRQHKAWERIFYSDSSAGLLFAARPQRM